MSNADIMDMPAMAPPPGVVANFDYPPNRTAMVVAVMSVCLAISTIAVALRFYSRCVILGKVQVQDYLLLVSFTVFVVTMGIHYRLANNPGWFVPLWDVRIRDVTEFMRMNVIWTYLVLVALIPMKTAILVEWISIFLPNGGKRRNLFFWACHCVIWANALFFTVMIIVFSVSCEPFQYLWDKTIEGGYCRVRTASISLSVACFLFSTDIIILFIPQRVIWTLNMSRRHKIGVSVVFALGIAACAASIVRLYYSISRLESAEVIYDLSYIMLTAVGEGTCFILALCAPSVPQALTGLKRHCLLPCFPSWGRVASIVGRRRSQESLKETTTTYSVTAWPASAEENNTRQWQMTSSEHHLVPLKHMPTVRQYGLEFGNNIYCTTEFEASTSYEPDRAVLLEQHSRQHPWIQR
ncbi:hypothetical protein diail_6795 [Diaporthe ilicicola]|nr:hypothetical protein diail_6795 [Diaporthe ilicicola]